jgi:hypothetical protein
MYADLCCGVRQVDRSDAILIYRKFRSTSHQSGGSSERSEHETPRSLRILILVVRTWCSPAQSYWHEA